MPNKKPLNKIPENLQKDSVTAYLQNNGFTLVHQGKVRNTFQREKDWLLIVATDRVSIFDFVLNTLVPYKGEVLTALTHFWGALFRKEFPKLETHLLQSSIHPVYNVAYDLKQDLPDLPLERSLVVRNLRGWLDPFELIFRNHIGGSVYEDYLKTSRVSGQEISPGLPEWSFLEESLFTPSTKEAEKHDINVTADYYFQTMGYESKHYINLLNRLYQYAYFYSEKRDILLLDTKFEGSSRANMLGDEFLTPDSTRMVEKSEWIQAMKEKRHPAFLDKQELRDWGSSIELNHQIRPLNLKKISSDNQMNINAVHKIKVPDDIIESLSDNYLYLVKKLTDYNLTAYQKKYMGVKI